MGDSVTYGSGSSDGNGYRLPLAENLADTDLRFIGSVRSGTMEDNYNEGHPEATIRDTAAWAQGSLGYRPNIILLLVGINDFDYIEPKETTKDAPERLGALIDQLLFFCPDAAILVAQLIHAKNPIYEERIQHFNDQIPKMVAKRVDAGHRVMVSDMRSITIDYLADGVNPTDAGYKQMADIWYAGIKAAYAKGWIESPIRAFRSNSSKQQCHATPRWNAVNKGQKLTGGLGHSGDAKFSAKWLRKSQASIGRGLDAAGVHFADLDGDGA